MQTTSLIAYHSLENKETKEVALLRCLKLHPFSNNRELSKFLGWEINRVTGRTNDLVKKGYVVAVCQVNDSETKRPAINWMVSVSGNEFLFNLDLAILDRINYDN